ncbi:hypothetical protein [Aeromonas encheleia]
MASAIALALGAQGCNDNGFSAKTEVKDDAYYRTLAERMVQKMTPEERLGMLVGPGYVFANGAFVVNKDALNNLKGDVPGSVGYINGVYNAESGLDIAASKLADGAAGGRITPTRDGEAGSFYGTACPVVTLQASTWDAALVKQWGHRAADLYPGPQAGGQQDHARCPGSARRGHRGRLRNPVLRGEARGEPGSPFSFKFAGSGAGVAGQSISAVEGS